MSTIGRIANNYARLVFDPHYSENVTKVLKVAKRNAKKNGTSFYSNIFSHSKDAFQYAEKKAAANKLTLWQSMKKQVTTLMPDLKKVCNSTGGIWSKTKGIAGQLTKRLPLIGAVATVLTEAPNIISAFKDKGLIGGILETGKSTARLGGFMTGMAIGQALIPIPILGGMIGGIAGDWLVSRVVGKSHTEQKEELLAQANSPQQNSQQAISQTSQPNSTGSEQISIPQTTMTQQDLMAMNQMLYGQNYGLSNPMDQDFMSMQSGMNLNRLG